MEHIKWLLCSDTHFPLQDNRAIELFLKVAKWWQPQAIDLAGDISDQACFSRWAEGTPGEMESFKEESSYVRQFLQDLHDKCPKAEDKHYHYGNHESRIQTYLEKNSPSLIDMMTPDALYGIKDTGFEWHDYNLPPVKRLGGMYVHHGESISKHSAESVRNDVQNHMVPIIRGHSHRMGSYYRTYPLAGMEIEGHEIGHLTRPELHTYQTVHDWQLGFSCAHVINGVAHVELIRIKDYTCVVDGRVFKA